jgi:hypothetical protein
VRDLLKTLRLPLIDERNAKQDNDEVSKKAGAKELPLKEEVKEKELEALAS